MCQLTFACTYNSFGTNLKKLSQQGFCPCHGLIMTMITTTKQNKNKKTLHCVSKTLELVIAISVRTTLAFDAFYI